MRWVTAEPIMPDPGYLKLLLAVGRCLESRVSLLGAALEGTAAQHCWGLPELPEAVRFLSLASGPLGSGSSTDWSLWPVSIEQIAARIRLELERQAVRDYESAAALLRDFRRVHSRSERIQDLARPRDRQ